MNIHRILGAIAVVSVVFAGSANAAGKDSFKETRGRDRSTQIAQPDDLSQCTSQGFPAKCCRQSVAQFGPFGSSYGDAKERRRAALQACKKGG